MTRPHAGPCHHAVERGADFAAIEVALGRLLGGERGFESSSGAGELRFTRLQAGRLALVEQLPFAPNDVRLLHLHLQPQLRLGDL